MRRIGAGVLVIVVCGAVYGSSQASTEYDHDYWFLGASADKTMLHYIDADSIVSVDDQILQAWTTILDSTSGSKFADTMTVTLKEVNCHTRQVRELRSAEYLSPGDYNEPVLMDQPQPWTYPAAGTFIEKEMDFICGDTKARSPFAVRLGPGVTPEQHAGFDIRRDDVAPRSADIS